MKQLSENAAELHYIKMTETPVARLVISLGIPTTISMLITNLYNMADTYFVGTLGETPQGAIGVLFTLQSIIQAFAFMLGHGSGTFVAKKLADKDADKASEYVRACVYRNRACSSCAVYAFSRFDGNDTALRQAVRYVGAYFLPVSNLFFNTQ